jgi:hypothetical protein
MESEIWRVQTKKIGSLEPFRSEYDMEAFLMNNQAIIGCWDPEGRIAFPALIRQQLSTKKYPGTSGRIDLVGISPGEKQYELRIFELKKGKIDSSAVEQLNEYINGWRKDKTVKGEIKKWILALGLPDINESNVEQSLNNPIGVLVGSDFDLEAINKASEYGFKGIRLSRFKAGVESEYYVIIEDQIGDVVKSAKRQQIGWKDFIESKLINETDTFTIKPKEGLVLKARPDLKSLDTPSKNLVFKEESTSKILKQKNTILKRASKYEKKWLEGVLQSIKDKKGIRITHATGIVYLAFGWPKSYWVPGQYWFHEKSKKNLGSLEYELKSY